MNATTNTATVTAESIRIGHVLVSKTGERLAVRSANTSVNPRTGVLDPTSRTLHCRDAQGVTRVVKVTFGRKIRVAA